MKMSYRSWIRVAMMTFAVPILLATIFDIAATSTFDLGRKLIDNNLDRKVHALIVDQPQRQRYDLVIAGDSRAERQLIPGIFNRTFKIKAVNIGVPNGEIIDLANAVRKYDILRDKPVLIISSSFFQLNDGAIQRQLTGMTMLMNLGWTDQIYLYRQALPKLIYRKAQMYLELLGTEEFSLNTYPNNGYIGVTDVMDPAREIRGVRLTPGTNEHKWYIDIRIDGLKWKTYREVVAELAASGCHIVIVSPPASPAWLKYTDGSFIDMAERALSAQLKAEASKYTNVHFVDFYGGWRDSFKDDMFYDRQHLNVQGGKVFTSLMCDEIARLGLLSRPATADK